MRIVNCKTNHLTNPIGYQMESPVFSYTVEESLGTYQTEARIRIAADITMEKLLFDTGFTSEINSLAYQSKFIPEARKRYYWDVTVKSDAGEEEYSTVNWFETGKREEEWQGKWITCKNKDGRHPLFFKTIKPKRPVRDGRLYICGLGLYEVMMEGKKVSEELLTPYCNNYHKWLQYQTYDITEELKAGSMLEVLLGNGWYKGRFGFSSKLNKKPYYSNTWKLIAEVHLTYEDGTYEVIGTDESWGVSYSKVTASSIYDGEIRDDTLPDSETENAVICTELMAPLMERLSTPVTVHERIEPVEIIYTPKAETVLDMGQNIGGIFELKVNEPAGTVIHLQFGEILQEGNFYRDNLRTAKAEYIYISDGKEHIIKPHFTYYGYRYVKVMGISKVKSEDFTALAIYSELPETGVVKTGHELVNRLISNTQWGLKGNFIDVPTDCPQRDERMGWTGDAQVFSPTACYMRDCYGFYRKYLFDLQQEQEQHNGLVPNVIPSVGNEGTSSVWGDAACIIPWNLYLFYGDKTILEDQFKSMRAWVDYVERTDGAEHMWREAFHFGDWLALDNPIGGEDQSMGATNTGFIADVYYLNSVVITARAAELIGRDKEAEYYWKLAEYIRESIKDEYYSSTGRCCVDTQTGHLLTLHFDLLPQDFLPLARKRSRIELIHKLENNGYRLQTGFVGTPLLCIQLSREGFSDMAYKLLLNEEYPGWLYEVKLGATTIWERWNSVLSDGSISSTGMNSLNHYAYGSVVEWIYRCCVGINPLEEEPGFRKVRIQPSLSWKLGYIKAECQTAAGSYICGWRILDENHVEFQLTVPFGCSAEVVLPFLPDNPVEAKGNPLFSHRTNDVCEVKAGVYHVIYRTDKCLKEEYSIDCPVRELMENPRVRHVLNEHVDWISKVPSWQWDKTLLEAAGRYGSVSTDEALDELNKILKEIEIREERWNDDEAGAAGRGTVGTDEP